MALVAGVVGRCRCFVAGTEGGSVRSVSFGTGAGGVCGWIASAGFHTPTLGIRGTRYRRAGRGQKDNGTHGG